MFATAQIVGNSMAVGPDREAARVLDCFLYLVVAHGVPKIGPIRLTCFYSR